MRRLDRVIPIACLLAFLAPSSALAVCNGQAPANTYCGNPTGALAIPDWKPFSAIPFPSVGGGTVVGNNGAGSAQAAATTAPVLGIPGTSTGQLGLAGSGSGTVTIKPQAAAGTYNFNLPVIAGSAGQPMLSGGGGSSPMTFGTLGLGFGGTNATLTASTGGIVYSGGSALAILSGTATARQMLQSGSSAAPAWSTTTWPATTTINRLLYSSAANVISDLATGNSSILVTDSGGIPSLSTTLPAYTLGGTVSGGGNQINNVIIGTTTPLAGLFTSVSASASYNLANLFVSKTAPTISSGCGGGSPSISAPNGTGAFRVTIGTASGSTCVLNMPTATTNWNCFANDLTTHTTANFLVLQTAGSTTQVTLTNFSDIAGAATWVGSDVIAVSCFAL